MNKIVRVFHFFLIEKKKKNTHTHTNTQVILQTLLKSHDNYFKNS